MKKSTKKIALRRETLHQLQSQLLPEVVGGAKSIICVSNGGGSCTVPPHTPACP